MDIEFKEVPELLAVFRKFFPKHFHIKFDWTTAMVDNQGSLKRVQVIRVEVNDTEKGGAGVEHWLLSYAKTLLTDSNEMDKCGARWIAGFQNARKKSTLDILGHKNVEAIVKAESANDNSKTLH